MPEYEIHTATVNACAEKLEAHFDAMFEDGHQGVTIDTEAFKRMSLVVLAEALRFEEERAAAARIAAAQAELAERITAHNWATIPSYWWPGRSREQSNAIRITGDAL